MKCFLSISLAIVNKMKWSGLWTSDQNCTQNCGSWGGRLGDMGPCHRFIKLTRSVWYNYLKLKICNYSGVSWFDNFLQKLKILKMQKSIWWRLTCRIVLISRTLLIEVNLIQHDIMCKDLDLLTIRETGWQHFGCFIFIIFHIFRNGMVTSRNNNTIQSTLRYDTFKFMP